MKKMMFLLMAMLMSFSVSTFAGTKTEAKQVENAIQFDIPFTIIVKQTVTFNDGKTIAVYYKKDGDVCKVYSKVDPTKYSEKDLERIKYTSFEIVDEVEGKCILTKKTADVLRLAKNLFGKLK